MPLRTLTRLSDHVSGHAEWNHRYYGTADVNRTRSKSEVLVDDVGPGDNRLFTVTRKSYKGLIANGTDTGIGGVQGGSDWNNKYVNYPLTDTSVSHLSVSSPSDGFLASQLLARTNPSRADVDLPIFIAELRDLPLLLKKSGDNLLGQVARRNLEWQFAIRPLISDLRKLLNFQGHADRRYMELKQLYNGGLRRTVQLFENSAQYTKPSNHILSSIPLLNVVSRLTSNSSLRCWGHVKWKPTTLPPKTDAELYALAKRAALGLDLNLAQAWELMPWSWLIDWFSSVGAFFNAHRNTVPAQPTSISIMRHQVTQHSYSLFPGSNPKFNIQWGTMTYETKSRQPATPTLDAYLPWLTLEQWSILGSLAILKGSKVAS